jgi:hypothetical protein
MTIPHYGVKATGHGVWRPSKQMRALGFETVDLGFDGPEAKAKAAQLTQAAASKAQEAQDYAPGDHAHSEGIRADSPLPDSNLASPYPEGDFRAYRGGIRASREVIEMEVIDAYDWQEVVSPDGVRCYIALPAAAPPTIEQPPMPTPAQYLIPDDLSMPEFLRRPLPRPEPPFREPTILDRSPPSVTASGQEIGRLTLAGHSRPPFGLMSAPIKSGSEATGETDEKGQLRTHAPQQDFRRSFNSIEAEQGASRPESCSAASAQLIFFERAEENARHQS